MLARYVHRPAFVVRKPHISHRQVLQLPPSLRALHVQHIRHLMPFSTAQTLACSLILSRPDYCNAVLYCCSAHAIGRLQHVQNYVACVMTQSNPWQPLLQSLHWLPVQQRLFQISTYHIQSHNHIESITPQWSSSCSYSCQTNSPFVYTSTAHCSLYCIWLHQMILLLCLTNCMELCQVMYCLVRHKQLLRQEKRHI